MGLFQRISARRGNTVNLSTTFYRGGVPTDPYAIRKVDIYKTEVLPSNLVAEFILPSPCSDTGYPSPVEQLTETIPAGDCGTEAQDGAPIAGKYRLLWDVPVDAHAPDIYFDVWSYIPVNPCELVEFSGSTHCDNNCYDDLDSPDVAGLERRHRRRSSKSACRSRARLPLLRLLVSHCHG